jgi:RNA polymerase sigma factor (sigma-70 family)
MLATSRPAGTRSGASTGRFEDDAALAAALLAREPWAAAVAWAHLSPVVYGFLRRYFGPGADHDDLCQEVFARFFSRIAELRVPHALRRFVIGICLGVAQNERRRANIRRAVSLTATGELPDVPTCAPDMEGREAVARLCQILTRVCAEDRGLFIDRYVEGQELAEIALATRRPVGTIKRRVAGATRRITAKMHRDPALAGYLLAAPEGRGRTRRPTATATTPGALARAA